MMGRAGTAVTTNIAVPTPKTGRDPETPTTSIAQGRRERKASGHEHILCPAPESTKNKTFSVEERDEKQGTEEKPGPSASVVLVQGKHRHSDSGASGRKETAALILREGGLLPTDGGKTIFWVAASKVALSPV
jgi:hypothetical protein